MQLYIIYNAYYTACWESCILTVVVMSFLANSTETRPRVTCDSDLLWNNSTRRIVSSPQIVTVVVPPCIHTNALIRSDCMPQAIKQLSSDNSLVHGTHYVYTSCDRHSFYSYVPSFFTSTDLEDLYVIWKERVQHISLRRQSNYDCKGVPMERLYTRGGSMIGQGQNCAPKPWLCPQKWHKRLFDELKALAYRCKKEHSMASIIRKMRLRPGLRSGRRWAWELAIDAPQNIVGWGRNTFPKRHPTKLFWIN